MIIRHQDNVAAFAGGHTWWFLPDQLISGPIAVTAAALAYTSTGKLFLFTQSEWAAAVVFKLETTFRSTDASEVGVRLFDETAAAAVAGSEVTAISTTLGRKRSGPITLADGHEYRVQVGVASSAGAILGASVVGLTPP